MNDGLRHEDAPGFGGLPETWRPYVRIHARAARSQSWDITDLWWVGLCPWPSMPVGHSPDLPDTAFHDWRCCPDDGPFGRIVEVEVHLPCTPRDVAFTVLVDVDPDDMEHLAEVHGFDVG